MNTLKRTFELMAERNLTLQKLAERSDVPYTTLKMAKRRGNQLSVDTIEKLCVGLGVTMSHFFAETSEEGTV